MLNIVLKKVRDKISYSSNIDDEMLRGIIAEVILETEELKENTYKDKLKLLNRCFAEIRQYGVIQELIEDDEITEIMVNGVDKIFVEKRGILYQSELKFESEDRLNYLIQKIVTEAGRTVNTMNPIVDARLENGDRVNVVLEPLALNGSILTIRKFQSNRLKLQNMVENGTITAEVMNDLVKLVKAKFNIFIAGGTGSGKTTLLNALSGMIGKNERVISIEDSAELCLENMSNWVRLETRNANSEGVGEIKMSELIKTSLRMRPDRIIVGEVRSSEAIDMLQAMNTGHDGSISTGHANSTMDMLSRIETMVLSGIDIPLEAIKSQINSAIDIIIYIARLRDGSRRVTNIAALSSLEDYQYKLVDIYNFQDEGDDETGRVIGRLVRTDSPYPRQRKFMEEGIHLEA